MDCTAGLQRIILQPATDLQRRCSKIHCGAVDRGLQCNAHTARVLRTRSAGARLTSMSLPLGVSPRRARSTSRPIHRAHRPRRVGPTRATLHLRYSCRCESGEAGAAAQRLGSQAQSTTSRTGVAGPVRLCLPPKPSPVAEMHQHHFCDWGSPVCQSISKSSSTLVPPSSWMRSNRLL